MIALTLVCMLFLLSWTYIPAPSPGGLPPTVGAISGTQSSSNGTVYAHSHPLSGNTNRKLLCAATSWNLGGNPATNTTTMLFAPGGDNLAMTLVGQADSRYHHVYLFWVQVPDGTSGSQTVQVTHTLTQDQHDLSCLEVLGAQAGGAHALLACGSGVCSGNPIQTVQADMVHPVNTLITSWAFNIDNPMPTVGTGQLTARHQQTAAPRTHSTTEPKTGSGTDNQLFTATSTDDMGLVGAAWLGQ